MALLKQTPWKLLLLLLLASSAVADLGITGPEEPAADPEGSVEIGLAGGADFEDTSGYGGSDFGTTRIDSDYDYEDSGYSNNEDEYSYDESDYGFEESDYGFEESDYGYDESDYGFEESDYGYDESDYGFEESDYGYDESDYGFEESDYGYDESDYGFEDSDYGYDESDYGFEDSDYVDDESDYGFDESNYVYDQSDYGNDYDEDNYGYIGDSYDPEVDFGLEDYSTFDDPGFDTSDFGYLAKRNGGRRRGVQLRSRRAEPEDEGEEDSREIEIEDGSVSQDEIPAGYFSPETEQQASRSSSQLADVMSGGIDMPGFRVIIGGSLQWWKFDANVCLQKEFIRSTEFMDADPHLSLYRVSCLENSATEYSCTVSQWNGTDSTAQRLTYTCCSGFTRLLGDRGCPRNVVSGPSSNKSFSALLRDHGYSQRAIDLFNTVLTNDIKRQWTVFVPSKAALETVISSVEKQKDQVPQWFVRTLLNHFAQPAQNTRSLRHGQSVATMAKPSSLLISKTGQGGVLVNCQPLLQANQAFNRYSVAHFTGPVLNISRQNLYQMMLERLENATSTELAKRLLAPLKPTLTGSKPVTVFMHLPATDETDNGCYAKNLRSAIVRGVECNASLSTVSRVRNIDGKLLGISRRSVGGQDGVLIDGNRLVISADHVATNGVLHIVRATESLTGFSNEVTRRLKSDAAFRPLFNRPNRTEDDLVLLLPPVNGSYSYANTSSRWSNPGELLSFGQRHLLTNATQLRGPVRRLKMMNGVARDFVQLLQHSSGASIFSKGRLVRRQFVDCVPVVRTVKDCGGTVYFLMHGELPDFGSSPTVMDHLSAIGSANYSLTKTILNFGIENNINGLTDLLNRSDVAIVLLKDEDMIQLSGLLLLRRRRPTTQQMTKLAQWFVRYFVAPRHVCSAKQLSLSVIRVPLFRIDQRPCRTFVCALRRQMTSEMRRVLLRPGGHVTVKEGFLLIGKVSPSRE